MIVVQTLLTSDKCRAMHPCHYPYITHDLLSLQPLHEFPQTPNMALFVVIIDRVSNDQASNDQVSNDHIVVKVVKDNTTPPTGAVSSCKIIGNMHSINKVSRNNQG